MIWISRLPYTYTVSADSQHQQKKRKALNQSDCNCYHRYGVCVTGVNNNNNNNEMISNASIMCCVQEERVYIHRQFSHAICTQKKKHGRPSSFAILHIGKFRDNIYYIPPLAHFLTFKWIRATIEFPWRRYIYIQIYYINKNSSACK